MSWGSEPSQQWAKFYGLSVFQFVGWPPGWYGIWLYHDCTPPTISLWYPLSFMWGVFWGGFKCPPINGCSPVVILVLLQELSTCLSPLPSYSLELLICNFKRMEKPKQIYIQAAQNRVYTNIIILNSRSKCHNCNKHNFNLYIAFHI